MGQAPYLLGFIHIQVTIVNERFEVLHPNREILMYNSAHRCILYFRCKGTNILSNTQLNLQKNRICLGNNAFLLIVHQLIIREATDDR